MTVRNSIADLRDAARRRVPRALFDYVDRGSYDELTLRRNRSDLEAVRLRQRVLHQILRLRPIQAQTFRTPEQPRIEIHQGRLKRGCVDGGVHRFGLLVQWGGSPFSLEDESRGRVLHDPAVKVRAR